MKEQIEEMAKDLDAIYNTDFKGDYESGLRDMAERLVEMDWRKQEWISIDDRLPENDYGKYWTERQRYLVYTEPDGFMYVAKYGYKEYGWWIDGSNYVLGEKNYRKVTHWMPLPEPPKMKGGEE